MNSTLNYINSVMFSWLKFHKNFRIRGFNLSRLKNTNLCTKFYLASDGKFYMQHQQENHSTMVNVFTMQKRIYIFTLKKVSNQSLIIVLSIFESIHCVSKKGNTEYS